MGCNIFKSFTVVLGIIGILVSIPCVSYTSWAQFQVPGISIYIRLHVICSCLLLIGSFISACSCCSGKCCSVTSLVIFGVDMVTAGVAIVLTILVLGKERENCVGSCSGQGLSLPSFCNQLCRNYEGHHYALLCSGTVVLIAAALNAVGACLGMCSCCNCSDESEQRTAHEEVPLRKI